MNKLLTLITTLALLTPAWAVELPPAARQEIQQLLTRLEQSGCQFNRNGSWYAPKDAKAHLMDKLDYFVRKGEIGSAEQFIEVAAAKSAMTGKPYLVQCLGAPQVETQSWLQGQLKQLRGK